MDLLFHDYRTPLWSWRGVTGRGILGSSRAAIEPDLVVPPPPMSEQQQRWDDVERQLAEKKQQQQEKQEKTTGRFKFACPICQTTTFDLDHMPRM